MNIRCSLCGEPITDNPAPPFACRLPAEGGHLSLDEIDVFMSALYTRLIAARHKEITIRMTNGVVELPHSALDSPQTTRHMYDGSSVYTIEIPAGPEPRVAGRKISQAVQAEEETAPDLLRERDTLLASRARDALADALLSCDWSYGRAQSDEVTAKIEGALRLAGRLPEGT